jgi:hypothetical protein
LSEEDGFLVRYHEAKERETTMLLRALCDIYSRWLDNAPAKEQIQSLWERYKDKLITRPGKAASKLFEATSKTLGLEWLGKLVGSSCEALSDADTDLKTAGFQLPKLAGDEAQRLINIL